MTRLLRTAFLDDIRDRVMALSTRAETLTRSLTADQLMWRPSSQSWCIAECLAHLAQTARQYEPLVQKALFNARTSTTQEFTMSWLGRKFIDVAGPTSRQKLKAPGKFRPVLASPESPSEFLSTQRVLLEFIERARAVDLKRTRLRSPISPLLRFSLAEALELLAGHGERHMNQAERVLEDPGFPSA